MILAPLDLGPRRSVRIYSFTVILERILYYVGRKIIERKWHDHTSQNRGDHVIHHRDARTDNLEIRILVLLIRVWSRHDFASKLLLLDKTKTQCCSSTYCTIVSDFRKIVLPGIDDFLLKQARSVAKHAGRIFVEWNHCTPTRINWWNCSQVVLRFWAI